MLHEGPQLDCIAAATGQQTLFQSSQLRRDDCADDFYSSDFTFMESLSDFDHYSPEIPSLSALSSSPSQTPGVSTVSVSSLVFEQIQQPDSTYVNSSNEILDIQCRTTKKSTRQHYDQLDREICNNCGAIHFCSAGCVNCNMTKEDIRRRKLERRRQQNRSSQRKFRARKEAAIQEASGRVADLEASVKLLEKHIRHLTEFNSCLRQRIMRLDEGRRAEADDSSVPDPCKVAIASPFRRLSILTEASKSDTRPQPLESGASGSHLALFDWKLCPPHPGHFPVVG